LTAISFQDLFAGTVLGFIGSAALVLSVALPSPKPAPARGIFERTTRGLRLYFATPRLRGLLALNLAVAAGGALVFVNTVVFVQGAFGLGESRTALALAAFGGGSMLVALGLPRLLDRLPDRLVMIAGAAILATGTAFAALLPAFAWLLPLWFVLGAGYGLALTPSGRLLRRSAHPEDRPAIFAAQFALSHVCWLITYPLAGWAGARLGLQVAALLLTGIAGIGILAALRVWPSEAAVLPHDHPDLPPGHPHLAEHDHGGTHVHPVVIDALHPRWPGAR
jgi:predicted MFS family arabinose efflux permease